jgi:hypothetical protein
MISFHIIFMVEISAKVCDFLINYKVIFIKGRDKQVLIVSEIKT